VKKDFKSTPEEEGLERADFEFFLQKNQKSKSALSEGAF
jgi:hypothetical protein